MPEFRSNVLPLIDGLVWWRLLKRKDLDVEMKRLHIRQNRVIKR